VAVMVCGRHGLWPSWLWPSWFVAIMVVAIMVCGRHGLWPSWFVAVMVCGRHCRTPITTRVNTWIGDCMRAGTSSQYVTSHLSQLNLPSLRGRLIEYQPFWLGLGGAHSLVSGGR